jgi:ubiquinone/menaquinone biosynthesis C-methylase UbiE
MPDLIDIPGFAELQALTRGDSRLKIAVLDGPADLDRACFQGGNISRVNGYWQQNLEPIDPFYIQQELKIKKLTDRKKTLKKTLKQRQSQDIDKSADSEIETSQVSAAIAPSISSSFPYSSSPITTIFNTVLEDTNAQLQEQYRQAKISKQQATLAPPEPPATLDTIAALENAIAQLEAEIDALKDSIPKPVQERLSGIFHATGIFGTMFGQPGSPVEGIAPYCTAINIPLFETATSDEALSPLNIAHAFNLALKLGVNIIHCAACHPTQTGFAHEMIQKAVKQCQDNNILIVAPSGNNKGEWFCVPAVLPNVLAVGMMKDNGQPANYSNWGGQYQQQGILAPGENVIAAQPGTDEPARQEGTSLAAPVITGISALLMTVQLQRGEQPNAEAVRQALLNSAIPCSPEEVEEPERCLRGKLNIPGAFQLLTGETLLPNQHQQTKDTQTLPNVNRHYDLVDRRLGEKGRTYQACLLPGFNPEDPDIYRLTNLFIANQAGIKPGDYILDAGCGSGGPSIDIAQSIEGVKIEGINLSEAQVNTARKLVHEAGFSARIRIQVGDYHYLPFADETFDIVLFLETTGYSSNLQQLFTEAYRILRPGCTLYIKEIFQKEAPLSESEKQELQKFHQREPHNTRYMQDVQIAIQLAGFQNIEARNLNGILTMCQFSTDCPFVCGDIKAQKPVAQNQHLSSSYKTLGSVQASEVSQNVSLPVLAAIAENTSTVITPSEPTEGITPSAASKLVYALGTISYDFGSEARRDTFKQLMPAVEIDGIMIPANPYDARQMVDYLSQNPSEAKALIWTLNQELTPVYALEPRQGFSADVYETLIMMLAGQIEPEGSDNFVERVSIPAKTTDKTVQLFSGQEVPVITIINTRGMYGWKINNLVEAALQSVASQAPQADEIAMRKSLTSFLNRVYFDFQNLGQTSKDRALNFSVTNAFQAASSFAAAVSTGMQLDTIEVEKSPFCRINSDCWDVKLKFFDPENGRRAKKVYRFTVDVSDRIPVTLGEVRSWSVPK